MIKILFINSDLGYGGAEKSMVNLANELSSRGFDVTFITYRLFFKNYIDIKNLLLLLK